MNITIDTKVLDTDDRLGQLLMLFLSSQSIYPNVNAYELRDEWEQITNTGRHLLVALMGDSVYDHRPHWTHLYHKKTELNVLWHHDGDISILFYKEGDDGFAIENHGSSLRRWGSDAVDMTDPRINPDYDPFK